MVQIVCDTLFSVEGDSLEGAMVAATLDKTDDLHYQCHYDLNYLFRGLVLCLDQDAGATGNISLGTSDTQVPTVAYLRAQAPSATSYINTGVVDGVTDAAAALAQAGGSPPDSSSDPVIAAADGGYLGGSFVCLPDNIDGYDHTVNQLTNLLYTTVSASAPDGNAAALRTTWTADDVRAWDDTAAKFATTNAITSRNDLTSDVGTTDTFATGTTAIISTGPVSFQGPMNSSSAVLVVTDEDWGDTSTNLSLASMMFVDAGLLAFTNNPNTNDILDRNGIAAHTDHNALANTEDKSLLYPMLHSVRGLQALADTSAATGGVVTPDHANAVIKTIDGTTLATATAVAGAGPALEKTVMAVAAVDGADPGGDATGDQHTCLFGRIMYDLIAGNAQRSIDASARVGATNFVSYAESAGSLSPTQKTYLGLSDANATALTGVDVCAIKKQYYACSWQHGDSLEFTWEINFSGNALLVGNTGTGNDTNEAFGPSYLTKNTDSANKDTKGYVTVGLTIYHTDLCGDSAFNTTLFNSEVNAMQDQS